VGLFDPPVLHGAFEVMAIDPGRQDDFNVDLAFLDWLAARDGIDVEAAVAMMLDVGDMNLNAGRVSFPNAVGCAHLFRLLLRMASAKITAKQMLKATIKWPPILSLFLFPPIISYLCKTSKFGGAAKVLFCYQNQRE
jgi:hypothetical protein